MKKTRTGRGFLAVLLTLIMILSLTACGGSSGGGSGSGSADSASADSGSSMPQLTIKDGVARAEEIRAGEGSDSIDGLQLLGMEDDWFYGIYYSFDSADPYGEGNYVLVRFQSNGNLEKIPLQGEDEGAEIVASCFKDGCFYLGLATYQNSEALDYALANEDEGEELVIPEDLSEDSFGTYKVACIGADGTPKWSVPVDASASQDDYYFIGGVDVRESGVYVTAADRVDLYDRENGSFLNNVCSANEEDMTGSLYVLQDGTVIMTDDFTASMKISAYDDAQNKFVQKCAFPSALQGSVVFPGQTCDFYLAGDDGVYGANLGSNDLTPVLNFVNSDLDSQGVVSFFETADGRYVIQVYGSDTSLEIYLLDPVAPEDVQEKTELTLGGYYIGFEVRSEVISFNKESDKYRISLVDYSQYDLETDTYYDSTGLSQMNTDIASGAAPDILLLSEQIPLDSYISKGVFEDLTDLFNGDTEIDNSDFLDNVMSAFKTDGRMYIAVPGFAVTGVTGKSKYIGDGTDLTISKARQIASGMGLGDSDIFGLIDRGSVFQYAIMFSGDQFIDRDAHSCDFNNDRFIDLLEFANLFPETISEEQYNDYFTQYLADRALLNIQTINTIYDYQYTTRDLFGDTNITVTGFPSEKNQGPAVSPMLSLGINSSCRDLEGCWSFVRRFYLPDFQMKMESCLPVSESAIDAQGEELIRMLREQEEEYQKYLSEMEELDEESEPVLAEDAAEGTEAVDSPDEDDEESDGDTDEELDESEQLLGVPVTEDEFDGTHEEYEAYLKEFEEEMAGADGTFTAEILEEEDLMSEPAAGYYSAADLPIFNEEDMAAFKEILRGLTYSVNEGNEVWEIISEEAEAYFAGQKSASEVADIIQSRVQVYLKENE